MAAVVDEKTQPAPVAVAQEKDGGVVETAPTKESDDAASEQFQGGVQRVRAITASWSPATMWIMFVLLFIVSFVDMVVVALQSSLDVYITSQFGAHGLLASTGIASSVVSACATLSLAKIIDIWGRIEGFIFMLLLVVISLIMKATATTIEVYFGAFTLYWVGHIGLMYVVDIMLADMTTLKNRALIYGINNLPTIASSFIGPALGNAFYNNTDFRWAYGSFAIILPVICLPVIVIMLWQQRKATKSGALTRPKSGRTLMQNIVYFLIEFDALGLILVTAAFALFLLPFSIVSRAPNGWSTPYIIAMIVTGLVIFPIFYLWEAKYAPVQFMPWRYLKDPTILGSCSLYGIMFLSTFCWNSMFYSYVQVVYRLDIDTASYTVNAYSLSYAVLAPVVGVLISVTGNFKTVAYGGIPLMVIGTALLIPFRTPDTAVGLVVMTQVLIGMGSAFFVACLQLAIFAPVTHQEFAVVSAINGMFGGIGASIGMAIGGGIWNNLMPGQLEARLPENMKDQAFTIFGDIVLQMSFLDGTPEREAVVGAYGYVQRRMVIAGVCFMPLCLLSIYMWRNINVKKLEEEEGKQTKGTVW
ncbi:siderochrome-iron transporter MirB [Stachybotrys elegans]|uniref:Siderochrome-iron transporter MirB n=1 Tax=Stachybotrys elegans TaxID=80388 RepID=A0A8K0SSY1_9HYPO|nr:siderochrome-iron transporter MirB [Stachybotrys elegans]